MILDYLLNLGMNQNAGKGFILPISKALKNSETKLLCDHAPFENSGYFKQEEYFDKVKELIQRFNNNSFSSLDAKVIDEIAQESLDSDVSIFKSKKSLQPKRKV